METFCCTLLWDGRKRHRGSGTGVVLSPVSVLGQWVAGTPWGSAGTAPSALLCSRGRPGACQAPARLPSLRSGLGGHRWPLHRGCARRARGEGQSCLLGWPGGLCGASWGCSPCALLPSAWAPRGWAGRLEEPFGTEQTLKWASRPWKWRTRASGQRSVPFAPLAFSSEPGSWCFCSSQVLLLPGDGPWGWRNLWGAGGKGPSLLPSLEVFQGTSSLSPAGP